MGIIEEATAYGAVMLGFRLLHTLGGVLLLETIFALSIDQYMKYVFADAPNIRKELQWIQ